MEEHHAIQRTCSATELHERLCLIHMAIQSALPLSDVGCDFGSVGGCDLRMKLCPNLDEFHQLRFLILHRNSIEELDFNKEHLIASVVFEFELPR